MASFQPSAAFKDISPPSTDAVVFTCTFYASTDDVRYRCCIEFLELAKAKGVATVVVDASPQEAIRDAMRAAGATKVVKQTAKGRKGAALREALSLAADLAPSDSCWLCWQEPEKVDMARHWKGVAADAMALDVVVPAREPKLFEATYPIEQFHSESFANAYVNLAARDAGVSLAPFGFDWHFGPFALRARHKGLWLENDGELWDAQVLPIVKALKLGLNVGGVEVPFVAPLDMKEEEEDDFKFVEKRLMQINFLDPKVVAALRE
mmetsp:Transcript_15134/g.45194  ORF Transcript_15134/g.45194 Transcript_15134/m.45194 type:complete len:265 (+) Transcript_15134:130-924(+)